ncbi:MAG: LCP family protein [Cyanobacteria bacterium P01_A01_bin.114]
MTSSPQNQKPSDPSQSASLRPSIGEQTNKQADEQASSDQAKLDASERAEQPVGESAMGGSAAGGSAAGGSPIIPTIPTQSRWRRFLRGAGWAAIFSATATVSALAGAALMLSIPLPKSWGSTAAAPPFAELWRSGFRYQVSRPVNVLVMGIDEAYDVEGAEPDDLLGRTDTMLLVRVDPETENVNILSIPRDTRVDIPGYGMDKINQANFEGGAELAAQTVSHNFDNVAIDRYVRVSTVAFREIVDLVDGVEVLVPKPMYYEDKTQGLLIDLEEGWQTLNGSEAEQFARFRQDSYGDIGRVQRQQILIKALKERLLSPAVIPQLPQIVRVLQRYIDTNLSPEEMLALASFGLQLEPDALHMIMLPGQFSNPEEFTASYWLRDDIASGELMQTYFDTEPMALLAEDRPRRKTSRLQIAVQNATEDPYAAQAVADHLYEEGFQNVYVIAAWPDVVRRTEIVAQRGDLDSAAIVESVLGTGFVAAESTGDIDSDITIRVGEDWLEQMVR